MRRLPQSLHDRAALLARCHPLSTVADILGMCPSGVTRLKKRGWIAKGSDPRQRPIPGDFGIQSQHMTHAELVRHYGAGTRTVSRWLAEKPRPDMRCPAVRRAR